MNPIQTSFNILKHSAIGVSSGFLYAVSAHHYIAPKCLKATSILGQYACLYKAKFFDAQKLTSYIETIGKVRETITAIIRPYFPDVFSLNAQLCSRSLTYHPYYEACCLTKSSKIFAEAVAEEFIFRYCIQKVILTTISKPLPERFKAIISSPTSRIILTSLFFAFVHRKTHLVLPHFIGGVIFGTLYEKTGFFPAAVSHATANLVLNHFKKGDCDSAFMADGYGY